MDQSRATDLRRLLKAAAAAHHAVYGGPNDGWPQWYAEWIYGRLLQIVNGEPSVDTVVAWLRRADAKYTAEQPEGTWPGWYAEWILEWSEEGVRAD